MGPDLSVAQLLHKVATLIALVGRQHLQPDRRRACQRSMANATSRSAVPVVRQSSDAHRVGALRRAWASLLEVPELPPWARDVFADLSDRLRVLDERIGASKRQDPRRSARSGTAPRRKGLVAVEAGKTPWVMDVLLELRAQGASCTDSSLWPFQMVMVQK
jgi:hypothetical protein